MIMADGNATDANAIPPELDSLALAATTNRRKTLLLQQEENRQEPSERGLSHKYRRRRYCDLTANDLCGIAHAANVQKRFYRDIAEEFHVSIGLVSRVSRK